jgi:hypothetical protein
VGRSRGWRLSRPQGRAAKQQATTHCLPEPSGARGLSASPLPAPPHAALVSLSRSTLSWLSSTQKERVSTPHTEPRGPTWGSGVGVARGPMAPGVEGRSPLPDAMRVTTLACAAQGAYQHGGARGKDAAAAADIQEPVRRGKGSSFGKKVDLALQQAPGDCGPSSAWQGLAAARPFSPITCLPAAAAAPQAWTHAWGREEGGGRRRAGWRWRRPFMGRPASRAPDSYMWGAEMLKSSASTRMGAST